MKHSELVDKGTISSKDYNNMVTRNAVQAEIEKDKEEFFKTGGSITVLDDFGSRSEEVSCMVKKHKARKKKTNSPKQIFVNAIRHTLNQCRSVKVYTVSSGYIYRGSDRKIPDEAVLVGEFTSIEGAKEYYDEAHKES